MKHTELAKAVGELLADLRKELLDRINGLPTPEKGEKGERGEKGEPGESVTGLQGEPGEKGDPGEPGQDRPLLQPVELKASREYPKNTVGTFAGGLWISGKQAIGTPEEDPHAWQCILDAPNSIGVKLLADHTFELSIRLASGQELATPFKIPYPNHKGVYQDGEDYAPGEIVTKGTAMFQAIEATDHAPPGNGWQQILVAPRGKQGAAGKPGKDVDPELVKEMRSTLKRMEQLATFFEDLQDGLIGGGDD